MAEEVNDEKEKVDARKSVSSNDKVVEEGKALAWLSYLGILFLIPLLAKKDNGFCLYHAKQGLVFFIIEVVLGFLGIIPFVGWVIFVLGSLFMLVLSIIGIIQTLQGNYWEAPLRINELAKKFNF